jgi:predicted aminopeptidase
LTHGTLFVKNNVNFNENLANFIGDKGAEQFLLQQFGSNSKEYIEYKHEKLDEVIYDVYILKSAERLDSLYKTMSDNQAYKIKKEKKNQLIQEIVQGVYDLPLFKKEDYFNYSKQAFFEGNAFFMTFKRYDSQYELFNKELKEKYNSDLKKYLSALKEKHPSL